MNKDRFKHLSQVQVRLSGSGEHVTRTIWKIGDKFYISLYGRYVEVTSLRPNGPERYGWYTVEPIG